VPQDITFDIPFAPLISPDVDRARAHTVAWLCGHGLLRSEAGVAEYLSWDLATAAAVTFPYSAGADLDLLLDFFSFAFLFDDQFDPAVADRQEAVAAVSREMITIPFRPAGMPPQIDCPVTRGWVDVWARLSDGTSTTWRNRFSANWARFMAAHAEEGYAVAGGAAPTLEEYVEFRRRSVGIHHSLDAAEPGRGFEIPPQVAAHPLTSALRDAAADAIAFMNDIHSLEREERRGDPHNLVTVLRRELRCSRASAVEEAVRLTEARLAEVVRLMDAMPGLYGELGLPARDRVAAEWGVEAVRNWIRGNHDWAVASGRYASAGPVCAPAVAYTDDLLTPLGRVPGVVRGLTA
jgi:germacradienol/geosmin synthase